MLQNLETVTHTKDESSKKTKNFEEIYLLKGLAILCIVVGHVTSAFNGVGWTPVLTGDYVPVIAFINLYISSFDLRLFFAIAGYLYAISSKQNLNIRNYGGLISRKFKRLIIPLIFLVVLNYLLTLLTGPYNDPGGYGNLGHLWYLIVLFMIFLTFPFFEAILKKNTSFALTFIIMTSLVSLYYVVVKLYASEINMFNFYPLMTYVYAGFFYFGYFCQKRQIFEKLKRTDNYNTSLGILSPVLIILIIFKQFINPTNDVNLDLVSLNPIYFILTNCFTIFYVMVNICFYWTLALKIITTRLNMKYLRFIGINSYSIYLLHVPIILLLIYNNLELYFNSPIVFSAIFSGFGIIIPLLFSNFAVKKNKVLSFLLGESKS